MNREKTKARLIELGVEPSKLENEIWDLSGANLVGASLVGANLSGANLVGARLYGARLYGAILIGANLDGANLYRAFLLRASLSGANLDGANLRATEGLTANQLAQAKNLEYAILDPGRYADAVAAGHKPEE